MRRCIAEMMTDAGCGSGEPGGLVAIAVVKYASESRL
jgi:hypothetical protein